MTRNIHTGGKKHWAKKRRKNQWLFNQPITCTTKNQRVKKQAQKKRSKPVDKKPE